MGTAFKMGILNPVLRASCTRKIDLCKAWSESGANADEESGQKVHACGSGCVKSRAAHKVSLIARGRSEKNDSIGARP